MEPLSRREFVRTVGCGVVAAGALPLVGCGGGSGAELVVADPGGPFDRAFREAFYRPFEEERGVRIVNVARPHQPTGQVRAMVETGSYSWDVVNLTQADQELLGRLGMLEELDLSGSRADELIPEARSPYWLGTDVYATVLCYRADRYGDDPPRSWADFWDVEAYPGRRSLRRSPIDTLEIALLADGVAPADLYPLDVDRAFAKLEEIRPHVDVWWTGGAQASQLLQSGEVDMLPTWNARAQTIIDAGGPVAIQWSQGLYSIEGWGIPAGNPRAELGEAFIRSCADPARQARFTERLAYGPTHPAAYESIPPERSAALPTAEANLDRLILADPDWWDEHKESAQERFSAWLLS